MTRQGDRYWIERVNQEAARVRAFMAALARYGQHEALCATLVHPRSACTCGLADALAGRFDSKPQER